MSFAIDDLLDNSLPITMQVLQYLAEKVEHLSLDDIRRIMQSKCITKRTTVGLEGGEFILHPQAAEIMAWFRKHHPNYTLLSNCLAPHRVIDAVRLYQPRHLYVSLDGAPETYQRMRGRDGYDRVIQVVETLKDEVPLSLMFCLSPWNNFDDMTFVIDIAKQYNVDVRIGIYGTMAFFDTTSELLTASGIACQQVAPASYILMFQHPHIVGTLELSTSYTWTTAEESLKVCTSSGVYRLSQMEELTFESKSSTILGIPIDKVHKYNKSIEHLYVRNNFISILPNNQVYTQGFFNELQAFVNAVEGRKETIFSSIEATRETYRLIEKLRLAYFANRLDDDSTIDDRFVS